jgi:hypothetical protein
MTLCITEDRMRRHWRIHRQTLPVPDGHQRWDRAYQSLLRWSVPPIPEPPPDPTSSVPQEVSPARSALCPGLDLEPSHRPDD